MPPLTRIPRIRRAAVMAVAVLGLVVGGLVPTAAATAAVPAAVAPAPAATSAVPSDIIDGGYLISDAEFFASGSLSAAQVQTFLAGKGSGCKPKSGGPACLKDFTADLPAKAADAYCGAITAKTGARASEIIATVAGACGINAKVIVVMLQKEQGLVTAKAPDAWSYRAAMGQSCPDDAPCSAAAAGFVNQVYLGARQMQIYTKNPGAFTYRAGRTNMIKWHPDAACGTSQVYIRNQATANLYNYTPYRPNISALAAGYNAGDPCSAYGNRNFYNYYVDWFAKDAVTSPGAPATIGACTTPPKGEIVARADIATLKADATTVRTAPSTSCAKGKVSGKKGTIYVLTGEYAGWFRLQTDAGATLWTFGTNATVMRLTPAPIPGRPDADRALPPGLPSVGPIGAPPAKSGERSVVKAGAAPKVAAKAPAKAKKSVRVTVPLRAKASGGAARVGELKKGQKVVVVASKGAWRKVVAGSRTGWVLGRHLG